MNNTVATNQCTDFVTIIEEKIFDNAPELAHRQFLTSNGFVRTGKVWKRIRQLPAKRSTEAESIKDTSLIA